MGGTQAIAVKGPVAVLCHRLKQRRVILLSSEGDFHATTIVKSSSLMRRHTKHTLKLVKCRVNKILQFSRANPNDWLQLSFIADKLSKHKKNK